MLLKKEGSRNTSRLVFIISCCSTIVIVSPRHSTSYIILGTTILTITIASTSSYEELPLQQQAKEGKHYSCIVLHWLSLIRCLV